MSPALDPLLVELLVCPEDNLALWHLDLDGEEMLYNPRLRRVYRVREGIPVLLIEESEPADEATHARLSEVIASGRAVETGRLGH